MTTYQSASRIETAYQPAAQIEPGRHRVRSSARTGARHRVAGRARHTPWPRRLDVAAARLAGRLWRRVRPTPLQVWQAREAVRRFITSAPVVWLLAFVAAWAVWGTLS